MVMMREQANLAKGRAQDTTVILVNDIVHDSLPFGGGTETNPRGRDGRVWRTTLAKCQACLENGKRASAIQAFIGSLDVSTLFHHHQHFSQHLSQLSLAISTYLRTLLPAHG